MSSVDNKIVRMQFDNAQFEQGVTKSMKTLDELNEKLQFKDAGKGISALQVHLDGVDFSAMARGIENLESRFSGLGIAGMNIVNKITDSIISAASKLESATIGQITSGGWTRASNIANARFTIEGLKYSWDEVRKAADYAVTDTAYGLDVAAKAASQLAASGIDFSKIIDTDAAGTGLTEMHKALRAISGVAAMTNSSYEEISHVFTRIAGQGKVMATDLNSIAARGLNAAATLAEVFHTTEAEIRDMVHYGEIDFQTFAMAMDEAYGEHAKEANKTFTGALSNMKAALSRIGAIFAQPIVDKTNTFFIAITDRIKEVQRALSDTVDNEGNTVIRFAGHFAEAWETGVNMMSNLVHAIDLSWFTDVAAYADKAAQKVTEIFTTLDYYLGGYSKKVDNETEDLVDELTLTTKEFKAIQDIVSNVYGDTSSGLNKLSEDGFSEKSIKKIEAWVSAASKVNNELEKTEINGKKLTDSIRQVNAETSVLNNTQKELIEQQKLQEKIKIHAIFNKLSVSFASVKRTGSNLIKVFKNLAGGALKGFLKAIDPTSGASSIKSFTFSIESLSESLIPLSERIAPKIETFVENATKLVGALATAVIGVTTNVTKFLATFINTKNEISDTAQTVKKSSKFFESLGKIFNKLVGFIRNLPEFMNEFLTSLKDQEGFKRLQDSLSHLWTVFKQTVSKAINPFSDALSSFADGELEGKSAAEILAIAVGNIAGHIADFTDKLPGYGDKVVEFFEAIGTKVEDLLEKVPELRDKFVKFIQDVRQNLNLGEGFDSIVDSVTDLASGSTTIWAKAKEFGAGIGEKIKEGIDSINFKKVGIAGVGALVMANLVSFFNIQNNLASMLKGFTSIPTAIGSTFKALTNVFKTMDRSIGRYMDMQVIISMVMGLATLAGVTFLLSKIPEQDLYRGISVIAILGLLIMGLGKAMSALTEAKALKLAATNQGGNFINIVGQSVSTFVGIATLVIAIAGSMKLIADAIGVLDSVGGIRAVSDIWGDIILVLGSLFGSMILMRAITNKMNFNPVQNGTLAVMTAALVGISLAVKVMADALKVVESISLDSNATLTMAAILGSVVLMVAVLGQAATTADWKPLLALTALLFVLTGVIEVIIIELSALAAEMLIYQKAGNGEIILESMGVIATLLLSMGISVAMMASAAGKMQNPASLAPILLSMTVLIAAIGIVISAIAKNIKDDKTDSLVGAVFAFVISFALIAAMISSLVNNISNSGASTDEIYSIGVVTLLISASMLIMAAALEKIQGTGPAILAALGMVGLIWLVLQTLTSNLANTTDGANTILSAGAAFLMISASLIIFASALQMISSIDTGSLIKACVVMVAFIAVMALLAGFAGGIPAFGNGLLIVGQAFLSVGAGSALLGAGLLLVTISLQKLLAIFPAINDSMRIFFETIAEHPLIFTLIVVGLIAIAAAFAFLASTLMPVVKTIATVILTGIQTIGNLLSSGASKLGSWFKNLSPKAKTLIVSIILALCGAIAQTTPEMLETIGNLIFKVLDFIIKIIPGLVDMLVQLLLELINGLANSIRKNAARIAAAFWNVVEALIEVILQVLAQGVIMLLQQASNFIPGGEKLFGNLINTIESATSFGVASMRNGLEEMNRYADSFETTTATWQGFQKTMSAATGKSQDKATKSTQNATNAIKEQSEELKNLRSQATATADIIGLEGIARDQFINSKSSGTFAALGNDYLKLGESNGESYNEGLMAGLVSGAKNGEDLDFESMLNSSGFDDVDIASVASDDAAVYSDNWAVGMQDSVTEWEDSTQQNIDAVDSTIDKNSELMSKGGKRIGHKIAEGIESSDASVKEYSARHIVGPISKVVNDFIHQKARLLGEDMANEIYQGWVSRNEIESPSKLYYRSAKFVPTAIRNSLKDNTYMATDAMTDLSDKMINSFSNPLDYVAKMVSGEIQYDPSIRPILDSSNIYRGAGSINSMFKNQNVSLSGLSGQIAYDMTTLNGSNAAVVAELQALREDMSDMAYEMENLQIVMDTGALVGSTVGAYDQALGKRSVYSKRGN